MNEYQYTRLPPYHSKIRLIKLQPGLFDTDLLVKIFHTPFSSKRKYEALSYVWGCPDTTRVLYVQEPASEGNQGQLQQPTNVVRRVNSIKSRTSDENKSRLDIAENLFIALQHLRYPDKQRVLWIDAIAINQKDRAERSFEVLEMGRIYNRARSVIVWLGPASHNSDLALQTLERIGKGVIHNKEEHVIYAKRDNWTDVLNDDAEALKSHADCWLAIKDLITREWFSRLWVFQEIALAQKAYIAVGQKSFDWKISTVAIQWIGFISARLDRLTEGLHIQTLFDGAIESFLGEGCSPSNLSICDALQVTGKLLCSDLRDRLFAVRGLLSPDYAALIVPDYYLEVENLYTNFAKQWLLQRHDAHFLMYSTIYHMHVQPPTDDHLHLPSWVPDWSHAGSSNGRFGLAAARCTGRSSAFWKLDENGSENGLSVQGVLVGRLTYVSPQTSVSATNAELPELCRCWMRLVSTEDLQPGSQAFVIHLLRRSWVGI